MMPYKTPDKIFVFVFNRHKRDAHAHGTAPALRAADPFDPAENGDLLSFFNDINQHFDGGPDGDAAPVPELKSAFG